MSIRSSGRELTHRAVRVAALGVLLLPALVWGSISSAAGSSAPPPGVLQLFAGGGSGPWGDGGPATAATLQGAGQMTHDGAGNVYVTDLLHHAVRRIDVRGVIHTVWAHSGGGFHGTGVEVPSAVAVDSSGTLFVADQYLIRKITSGGVATTVAGGGTGVAEEGSVATAVRLGGPQGLTIGPDGTVLFSDQSARVYQLTSAGTLHVVAGVGAPSCPCSYGDDDGGPARTARLGYLGSLRVAPDGTVLVADVSQGRVRALSPSGTITTVLGGGAQSALCDGVPAGDVRLQPVFLALDRQGRLLVTDQLRARVLRLEAGGTVSTVAGTAFVGGDAPERFGGPALTSALENASGLDVEADGTVLVASFFSGHVVSVAPGEPAGVVTGVAGIGSALAASEDGSACSARLGYPTALAAAPDGSTYVADYRINTVRRITPDGRITTVAGTGRLGYGGDGGPGTAADLSLPRSVAVDPAGRVLIADTVNNRVRRLDPVTGIITTIAGTGQWGAGGDGGLGTAAQLAGPHGVAAGPDGAVWIADTGNARVRRLDPRSGVLTTVAGTGIRGSEGDGGAARLARLTSPRALTTSADGATLFVSDDGAGSVRTIDLASGRISTVVGPATGRPLVRPAALVNAGPELLIAESGANRVLRVDLATRRVDVLAGTGRPCPRSEVPALAGEVDLCQPQGLTLAPSGGLLVADTGRYRVLLLHR